MMLRGKLQIVGDVAYEIIKNGLSTSCSVGGSGFYTSLGASCIEPTNYNLFANVGIDFDFSRFNALGITTEGIRVIDQQKTGRFITTIVDDEHRQFSAEVGALSSAYIDVCALKEGDIVYLSGSHPLKQLAVLEQIKGFRGEIAADVFEGYCEDYRDEIMTVFKSCKYVFMNDLERQLLNYSPSGNVFSIIKHGSDGASFWRGAREIFRIDSPVVPVRNTIGAGDILAGAFLEGILVGKKRKESLSRAVTIASLSVTFEDKTKVLSPGQRE